MKNDRGESCFTIKLLNELDVLWMLNKRQKSGICVYFVPNLLRL